MVVFSDFDGTIAQEDLVVRLQEAFAPEGWQEVIHAIVARKMSVRQGVARLFADLSPETASVEGMLQFVQKIVHIRDGFWQLDHDLANRSVPLVVLSGGMRFWVEPLVAKSHVQAVYCNDLVLNQHGKYEVAFPYGCDALCDQGDCSICKGALIRKYDASAYFRIFIGDGVTDYSAALAADFVFARDRLLTFCQERNIAHCAFEHFYDVIEWLHDREGELW